VRTTARLGVAALLLALTLSGCETTAEKSAQIEKTAKHVLLREERGLTITRKSRSVQVLAAQILHTGESTAAVITLRNTSPHAQRDVPIAITVRNAHGTALFQNNGPGLEAALTTVALLPAGGQAVWVDDQVQASGAGGAPMTVSALVGEGAPAPADLPRLQVNGVHPLEDPASGPGAAGTVVNDSAVTQSELVVYALARRAGKIVAAGRAVLPEVSAHGSSNFELFFVGDPHGAQLELSAPPSTVGGQ
jgi:hypothetical protein